MLEVIKRDGTKEDFTTKRIFEAVYSAAKDAGYENEKAFEISDTVTTKVVFKVLHREGDEVTVESIQDDVEKGLMSSKYKDVAKKYIEYRSERDRVREGKSQLHSAINSVIDRSDPALMYENGNLDSETLTTQRTLLTGEVAKVFADNILPKSVVDAHEDGTVHFHDKNFNPLQPYTNCCLIDLKGTLEKGFTLGGASIGSPKSVGVATAVTAQIIAQVSSSQYGGTSIANIDTVVAPYVEMNKQKHLKIAEEYNIPDAERYAIERTEKDTYDAFQALEYEINSLFNSHAQSPFTTLSFGTGTSWAERLIQKCILEVRIKGLGENGVTAIFPKLIMFIEEGINLKPEDPNYDLKQLALKCAATRMYPDIISSKNNRDITGSKIPVTSMGCRSFLSVWKDENGEEVLDGRQNLGVHSLNLPMIGLESKGDLDKFWKLLDEKCEIAYKGMMCRIKAFEGVTANVAPVLYMEGAFGKPLQKDDKILDLFKNGRASLSLGYIGLAELAYYMFDTNSVVEDRNAYDFTLEVAQFLRDKCDKWKKESGWGTSLYSTPSEGYCSRALEKCKVKYGVITNVTDKDYFTNSFHVDVREKIDPFTKIDLEAPFHWIANAGHISYCEFPDMTNNLEGLEAVWDYAMEHLDYFGTNTGTDRCFCCSFQGEAVPIGNGEYKCPECGNDDQQKLNVCRRISGYLGQVNQRPVNKGKQNEFSVRVKHK